MTNKVKNGVAICHFNRHSNLFKVVEAVKETVPKETRVIVCDDGSSQGVEDICNSANTVLVKGPNKGVAFNKNRALFSLQDCDFMCILEDDLMPIKDNWFETYIKASIRSGIHHFCRVQDKLMDSKVPEFDSWMQTQGLNPIYGPSPRGDLTFITNVVTKKVGGLNNMFSGAGYAHGEWSERIFRAGLIRHPNKWIDIEEASNSFIQIGDTEGGRWEVPDSIIKNEIKRNKEIFNQLKDINYLFCELRLE